MKLYEFGSSRSARCVWTLRELGLDYESVDARGLIGSDELKRLHPLGKLPALEVDGRALFESAAICTYLADREPDAGLVAPPGSWERALHDQWVSFTLSELEAYLWSSAHHTWRLPEDERVGAIVEPNDRSAGRALDVLERVLADVDYLVANRFSVTDIIAGYAVNWAALTIGLGERPNLVAWLERLHAREHCTLSRGK